jgi:hypothetical protein
MADLNDYNQGQPLSLEDFHMEKDVVAPVYNKASTANLAATSAAISSQPDKIQDDYNAVIAETSETGQSITAKQLQHDAVQGHMAVNKQALLQIMGDPNIPDEVKQRAAAKVYDSESDIYSPQRMLALSSLNAPVKDESHEEELQRVNVADALSEVDNVRRVQQQILNRELTKNDPTVKEKVANALALVLPFSSQGRVAAINNAAKEDNSGVENTLSAILAHGTDQATLRDMVANTPPENRLEVAQHLIDAINAHSGIVASSENDFARMMYLQNILGDGTYTSKEEWTDNVMGILDMVGIGSFISNEVGASRAAKAAERAEKAFTANADDLGSAARGYKPSGPQPSSGGSGRTYESNAARDASKGSAQPQSLINGFKDTNVDKYRTAHEAMASDESGQVAQAIYGTNRTDALVNDLGPELGKTDGSVKAKPANPDAIKITSESVPPELTEFMNFDGANQYFQQEKASARAAAISDFQQAFGNGTRKEMMQISPLTITHEEVADGVKISGIYGPQVGGFSNARDAIDMMKWMGRNYGIDENHITVLNRQGTDYLPVKPEDITTGKGDYLLQLDYHYKFNPADEAIQWKNAAVSKWNFVDFGTTMGAGTAGQISNHVFDAASLLDPTIFQSAVTSTDRATAMEKILLKLANDFAEPYRKLPLENKKLLNKMISDANEKGIEFNYAQLRSYGLPEADIKAYQKFRDAWNTIWHLENRDLSKTLRTQGWQEFSHYQSDTSLIAKPVSISSLDHSVRVYDVNTGDSRVVSSSELVDLYNSNGTIARLRNPITVGDRQVEHVVVPNNPSDGYMRTLTDNTQVLAYRPGYYAVKYKDPHFIEKVVRDNRGEIVKTIPVATAKNTYDADVLVNRMSQATGEEFQRRLARELQGRVREDAEWDLAFSQGRSAQRVRGKRLQDSNTNILDPSQTNIQNPVESLVNSIRSISKRTALRDWFDATGTRILNQYENYLPKDQFGQTVIPGDLRDIKYRGKGSQNKFAAKQIADARTSIGYFNYMKRGYINILDDGAKAALGHIASSLGEMGFGTGESIARNLQQGKGLTNSIKGLSFNLFIALNPLRQFIVQANQATMLAAVNPTWLASRAVPQIIYMVARQLGISSFDKASTKFFEFGTGKSLVDMDKVWRAIQNSGQIAAIDRHALVNGALADMGDKMVANQLEGTAQRAKRLVGMPFQLARKLGFDSGEFINTVSSYLAQYDLAEKAGKNMSDAEVLGQVAGAARNFTGNMNSAGDMAYNQNVMGGIMQYQQQSHKIFLMMLTNRGLSTGQKLAYAITSLGLFGAGTWAAYSQFFSPIMPKDPKARQAVAQGLEATMLNALFSNVVGESVNMDWKGLAPYDMFGTMDLIHGLLTTDAGKILSSTPTGSLFFGSNPRVTRFVRAVARYTNLIDDYQDPTTFSQVAMDFAKLSSGYSNAMKAAYALKYREKMSTTGRITDSKVNTPEAILSAFGFQTWDEAINQYSSMDAYLKSKQHKDDVNSWYNSLKNHLNDTNITPEQLDYTIKVHSEAWRAWADDDIAKTEVDRLLKQDLQNGDFRIYQSALRTTDLVGADATKARIQANSNMTDEEKAAAVEAIDIISKANAINKGTKE